MSVDTQQAQKYMLKGCVSQNFILKIQPQLPLMRMQSYPVTTLVTPATKRPIYYHQQPYAMGHDTPDSWSVHNKQRMNTPEISLDKEMKPVHQLKMPGTPNYTYYEPSITHEDNSGSSISMLKNSEQSTTTEESLEEHQETPGQCDIDIDMMCIDEDKKRYISVGEYRGLQYIKIRDYYYNYTTHKWCVGRRGINLTRDQWHGLKSHAMIIDAKLSMVMKPMYV